MNNSPLNQSPSHSPLPETIHRFSFTGTGGGYFPIWLTNLALTVITLGIYGAWAKVRKERYFHEHTHLNGSSFEYTANPISILKGRLIVFGIFIIFAVTQTIPFVNIFVLLLLFIAAPKIVTQAIKFRARYTNYRNIPFRFSGTYGRTFIYFFLLRIPAVLTLGLLFPWVKHAERKYLVDNLGYGKTNFSFGASVKTFYKCYLSAAVFLLLPLTIFILRSLVATFFDVEKLPGTIENGLTPQSGSTILELISGSVGAIALVASFFVVFSVGIPLVKVLLARATWSNTSIGSFKVTYNLTFWSYVGVLVTNILLLIVTLGLAAPFCMVRLFKYKIDRLSISGPTSIDEFVNARETELRAFGDEAADVYDLDIDFGL